MIHELKCRREYFKELVKGTKTFELRNNDRNFKVGDIIALNELDEYDLPFPTYTGFSALFEITYILDDLTYLHKGMVALGIKPLKVSRAVNPDIIESNTFMGYMDVQEDDGK